MTRAARATTAFDYSVFGLHVRSQLPLPELLDAQVPSEPQVTVTIGKAPEAPAAGAGPHRTGGGLLLVIADVARYFIKDGSSIIVEPEPGVPEANVRLFLLGSAMGALLHQRGLLPLHANAVELGGRAFAFMGRSGAGKSTLAAWFHDHGHRVLGDDVCAVRVGESGPPRVSPGLPRLRLWKNSLEATGRDHTALPRSFAGDEDYEKYDVALGERAGSTGEIELGAIYLLETGEPFSITRLGGMDAAEAIIANTYRGEYVAPAGAIQRHWEACVRLARQVPVYQLERSWDLASIGEVGGLIVAHAADHETSPNEAS